MKRRILIYGHDSSLLDIRAALVRSVGFDVLCAYTRSQLEQLMGGDPIDALILCHTISAEEDEAVLLKAKVLQPQMKVLVLNANQGNAIYAEEVATLDIWSGPRALIETLQTLVAAT